MNYNPKDSVYYNKNIEYLFNSEIIEYDMRDAGFSIIKEFKLLSPDKINELEMLPKGFKRHKAIGMLQHDDREFSSIFNRKFGEVRDVFVRANDLTDNDIISVKKDAFFTIGECNRLKFGKVEFVPKNRYSSYLRFSYNRNLEIYYSNDKMDIKGMSDVCVNKHRIYLVEFLRKVIGMIECKDSSVKRYVMEFVDKYLHQELEEGYYLAFDSRSDELNPTKNYYGLLIPLVEIIQREVD